MHFHFDEFVGPFEQLSSKDDDGGGAISDLCILQLCKLDEKVGGGVLDFEFLEDGGTWIGHGIPSLVMVISPISSTIILSRPWGPREDLTMLATDMAARTI